MGRHYLHSSKVTRKKNTFCLFVAQPAQNISFWCMLKFHERTASAKKNPSSTIQILKQESTYAFVMHVCGIAN